MPRAFAIGLSCTGASGVCEAFNQAYISATHCSQDPTFMREVFRGEFPWTLLNLYDGVTGPANLLVLPRLLRAYPEAKFVITYREKDEWLRAIRRSWEGNPEPMPHSLVFLRGAIYNTTRFNEEVLSARFDYWTKCIDDTIAEVNSELKAAGSPELSVLRLDVTGGEGWEKLAPFLQMASLPPEVGGGEIAAGEKRPLARPAKPVRTFI